jgi:hypothetical protein
MRLRLGFLLVFLVASLRGGAQQLLWESLYNPVGSRSNTIMYCSVTRSGQLLTSCYSKPPVSTCQVPDARAAFRLYDLNGTLVREQLGRSQVGGEHGFRPGTGSRYWWSGSQPLCPGTPGQSGSQVQCLTAHGDTLLAWPMLAPAPPSHRTTAVLEDGRRLLAAGFEPPHATNNYQQRYTLTSVDTATGQVRWRYAYDRSPVAGDYSVDLVRTPRGGYLISGDGQLPTGFQHLF